MEQLEIKQRMADVPEPLTPQIQVHKNLGEVKRKEKEGEEDLPVVELKEEEGENVLSEKE
jgi:hypothetical protein